MLFMVGHEEEFIKRLFSKKLNTIKRQKQVMKCSQIFLALATKKLLTKRNFTILYERQGDSLVFKVQKLHELKNLTSHFMHLEDLIDCCQVCLYLPVTCL